jgi:hypothetical protein
MRARLATALLLWGTASAASAAEKVALENAYVRVTRGSAPCAAAPPECGDRVLVALGGVLLEGNKKMARGDVLVFEAGKAYPLPLAGDYYEVSFKPDHPQVETAPVQLAPEKNRTLYDGARLFVFEERLMPGETRARHSHAQRVVVVINETKLRQWPDGAPEVLKTQIPDDVHFNEPVVHVAKNVGEQPLRNIVIELKPGGAALGR